MSDAERKEFVQTVEELAKARALIEEQAKQIEKLRRENEEWRRGHRTRNKRFSSRSEVRANAKVRPPGRKLGHEGATRPVPTEIASTEIVAMPEVCGCGGCVESSEEVMQTVVEDIVPVAPRNVMVTTRVGKCTRCGKRVVARLPGGRKDGSSVVATQLGPRVSALVIDLRFGHHVPLARIATYLSSWHGLRVTAGGLSHLVVRSGVKTAPARAEIQKRVQDAPVVGSDETGLRQSGHSGYAWLLRTPEASLFHVDPSRGGGVFDSLLPKYQGVVASDFYSVYTGRGELLHAYCGAHLIRESKKIAELDPSQLTTEFASKLVAMYQRAGKATSFDERDRMRSSFAWLCREKRFSKHKELRRLQERIKKNFEGVVAFLGRDDIPWNNNATERDLRPLCVHRKVTGGTRSKAGSQALGHWMSVTQTLRKNGIPLVQWLPKALDPSRSVPSVFR